MLRKYAVVFQHDKSNKTLPVDDRPPMLEDDSLGFTATEVDITFSGNGESFVLPSDHQGRTAGSCVGTLPAVSCELQAISHKLNDVWVRLEDQSIVRHPCDQLVLALALDSLCFWSGRERCITKARRFGDTLCL